MRSRKIFLAIRVDFPKAWKARFPMQFHQGTPVSSTKRSKNLAAIWDSLESKESNRLISNPSFSITDPERWKSSSNLKTKLFFTRVSVVQFKHINFNLEIFQFLLCQKFQRSIELHGRLISVFPDVKMIENIWKYLVKMKRIENYK